ncbi:hypothetical protein D3C73_1185860 [compost metagenome]
MKSAESHGRCGARTVAASRPTEPTKPNRTLPLNELAMVRKNRGKANEAVTDANWSTDSEPIRMTVPGCSLRATKSATTTSGSRIPSSRKNRFPRFQRL